MFQFFADPGKPGSVPARDADRRASGSSQGGRPADARVRFAAPTYAASARLPARFLVAGTVAAAAAAAVFLQLPAVWPTQSAQVTTVAFVAAVVLFNWASAYQRIGEFARVIRLDAPLVFGLLLLVDWRTFVIAVAVAELGVFIADRVRGSNAAVWYMRLFFPCELVVEGAAASLVLHLLWAKTEGTTWSNPSIFLAILAAALVWKMIDMLLTHFCLALASGTPLGALTMRPAQLAGELAVLFAAVPLAALWDANAWLSLFAFASIAGGGVLLHVSEIEHRLHIDQRTGLTNAAAFDDQFAAALHEGKRGNQSLALLVIDIDHFKNVNDSFGHDIGDRALAWFAGTLAAHTRDSDLLARIGGEEFALLIRDTTREQACELAERLRRRVAEEPYGTGSTRIPITASIGLAMFPDDGDETRDLFRSADTALYDAKRGGRNAVRSAATAAE